MDFNFSPVIKRERRARVKKESNIVEKNVYGVIRITLEATYFTIINGEFYHLSNASFDCRNRDILFSKTLVDNNIIKAIKLTKCEKEDYIGFLPFSVGCYAKGNLIRENNEIKFDFKTTVPYDEEIKKERVKAIKFFIEHYDDILPNLIKEEINV